MKSVALHNLGCKVNAYETEAMQQRLEDAGYDIVPFSEHADIYVIHTCTVTNMADHKSRQMLHRARKNNPDALVIAVGCYVQAAAEQLQADPAVDLVIGNQGKQDIVSVIEKYGRGDIAEAALELPLQYEELTLDRCAEHTRAYLKVQDGCNQFCSYCIIPYVRGRVRSRQSADVVDEVKRLAAHGYREIVLTGIHLSSYGIDLENGEGLLSLLKAVHDVQEIERIRLGSLEPRIITPEFVEALRHLPKLCPHFHLSLQSGCDATLRRMNRRYTAAEYMEKCRLLRTGFSHPAITTDVIVGFPGETDEEFAETKRFVKEADFFETHIFKYSRRKGTRADAMKEQIDERIKSARSAELLALNQRQESLFRDYYLGKEVDILAEEQMTEDGQVYTVGYSREYVQVAVRGMQELTGQVVRVTPKGHLQSGILYAEVKR